MKKQYMSLIVLVLCLALLTNVSAYWIYQEDANSTSYTGDWTNPENLYDGNWSSYGDVDGGVYYFNYSVPNDINLNTSLLHIKYQYFTITPGIVDGSYAIPYECDNEDNVLQFMAENPVTGEEGGIGIACYDSDIDNWQYINYSISGSGSSAKRFYEEGVYWDVTDITSTTGEPTGAFDLWTLFVDYTFGNFWMTVIGLIFVMFIILLLGRISIFSNLLFCLMFLLAITLGYGLVIVNIFITLLLVIGTIFSIKSYIDARSQ
jgi:hypothetical protein